MNKKELLEEFDKLSRDSIAIENYENCYDCKDCILCHSCNDCYSCYDCFRCYNCNYCRICSNCILCVGIDDKIEGYWLLNKEVTKEVFDNALAELKKGE